jgi:uncharacterized protein (DUF1697 family)
MAFLRAINVGGHTVKKATLVEAFEEVGCEDVSTFIASGNVVFRSSEARDPLEAAIEAHLGERLGYDVDTFVRTHTEVRRIAAADPFPSSDLGGTLQVLFLKRPLPAGARKEVAALRTERDVLEAKGREIYWLTAGGISESAVDAKALGRVVGATTARNMNTIRRLAEKHPGS